MIRSFVPRSPSLALFCAAAVASGLRAAETPKPVFASHRVTAETVGHAVDIDVKIPGAKKLYLVVQDGGDGYSCDWVNWVRPEIHGSFGVKKLTQIRPVRAESSWGRVRVNRNAGGGRMVVNGEPVEEGIGAHAVSLIEFDLPEGVERFTARGALDKGGVDQGFGATVVFEVYTEKPPQPKVSHGPGGGPKEPDEALAALEPAEGLKVETFAAEPMLLSPSAIDVDHLGRVWVAEIVNYRGHNGKRPEGDRILVLEDTDGDGRADRQTVFHQGTDILSPHGLLVMGNQVIVSASGRVVVFTDRDGDLKADESKVLFSGVKGEQHDHGIHTFRFGPDGKLYFNFGNEGRELRDGKGEPIVDRAGNLVAETMKPYQQGMIFRCDPDGSNLETLAWNFRNNWEVCVDSFGSLWQSDNDDDGNRSVRINFVMPYGNYGFRDEITGANWRKGDARTAEEIAARHWHQADPGVVPNLLITGAGSPTGIVVYEGDLLPEVYRGQMLHCDAGPNVVRSYPVKRKGAGYTAETVNLLVARRDNWFRPSDVCVAPDGSVFVADWYDPGVGGHGMGDLDHGRVYRITPKEHKGYQTPAIDLSTPEGAVKALASPNEETRYLALTALGEMKERAIPALEKALASENPRLKARALWALSRAPGRAEDAVKLAAADRDEDVRVLSLRLAQSRELDVVNLVKKLADDESAAVRRECALALRFSKSPEAPALWAKLAAKHDGADRWYLEALGIGAALNWDACLDAWLAITPNPGKTPGERDIIWRSRAKKTAGLLAGLVKSDAVPEEEKDRFMRAFDFQPEEEREKALESLLE